MEEKVILVNTLDTQIGVMEKEQAHRTGKLHRAFSVFIFNNKGELLLQKRSVNKYHSGGLWSNTCCSHPLPGEETLKAAHRRLEEEMGLKSDLQYTFKFLYHAVIDEQMTEHEIDHVFIGHSDNTPRVNYAEAEDWKYVDTDIIFKDIQLNPTHYTVWFQKCVRQVISQRNFKTKFSSVNGTKELMDQTILL
ncbi:MAG: isopentenyl-diphosphate Delta-isomerase [Candidatus Dadabacteria bacterium]